MRQISILGCGWLGFPLAQYLISQGFSINGSTTTEAKLQQLEELGINPFLVDLNANHPTGNIQSFLEKSDLLIIDIPPRVKSQVDFTGMIATFIPYIEDSEISKVIFISSTSVYGNQGVVSEETVPQPDTESGRQLLEAEQLLRSNRKFDTTIIRFAGLIGDDRHPVHSLSGKSDNLNPQGCVNLIHQQDCIGIISAVITTEAWNEIFNGVAPYHPTRENYYTLKAVEAGIQLPVFNQQSTSQSKMITSNKVGSKLDYKFVFAYL